MISREIIERIRERAQIEEIVSRYVPSLKRKGKNYTALCPFHKEKTPSFTVSPDKQIFYCFGCHIGGNVFSFISRIERLNFPESVRFIGGLVGVEVKGETNRGGGEQFDRLKKINYEAMNHYHKSIKAEFGREGRRYLMNRGISKESIIEFRLGFSPDSWNFLTNHFKDMNIPLSLPSEVGLIGVSEKGGNSNYYDRFRNRIIFPIFSRSNDVIGFGGRIIGNGEPKYINSPESSLFKKREVLYGMNIAQEYIQQLDRAIVVEGYLDVIGCHQAGIKNVVAPLGTALTSSQIRLLARFCNEVILLFDADSSGFRASLRSLETLEDISIEARIAVLPEGDPFEFIINRGVREFMVVVDSSLKPLEFRIEMAFADYQNEDRLTILFKVFNIIKDIKYETERDIYFKKVSSHLKVDENSIREDYKKFIARGNKYETKLDNNNSNTDSINYLTRSHRELILLLCNYPELIERAILDFTENEFIDPIIKDIYKKLIDLFYNSEKISIDRMFDFFSEGKTRDFFQDSLFRCDIIDSPDGVYNQLYLNIKLYQIDQKINRYISMIQNPDYSKKIEVNEYLAEIDVLRREKEKLSPYLYNKII